MRNKKECPFCANEGSGIFICIEKDKNGLMQYYIECCECGARSAITDSEEKAWKLWNRREKGNED